MVEKLLAGTTNGYGVEISRPSPSKSPALSWRGSFQRTGDKSERGLNEIMCWLDVLHNYLGDMGTVCFFLILVKLLHWDATGWARNRSWLFWIVGCLLFSMASSFVGVIVSGSVNGG